MFERAHEQLRGAGRLDAARRTPDRPAVPPRRLRLDAELVRRGLARSREHASELIAAGPGQGLRRGGDQAGDRR